jgi:hypothetical protein
MLTRRGRVRVTNVDNNDNSTIFVSRNTLQSLQLFQGDITYVRGKSRNATVLIILVNKDIEDGCARIADVVSYNLNIKSSEKITILPCLDIEIVSEHGLWDYNHEANLVKGKMCYSYTYCQH